MKVISSMATRHLLSALLPSDSVESVGGVDAARRVAAGEPFDVVVLAADALAQLRNNGHVGVVSPFVLSQTAVAVPDASAAAAPRPSGAAYASAGELRAALRAASRIGYSTGPSGTALVRMISEWGLRDAVGELIQARAGVPVASLLASGSVDLGFQQLSELVGQPGIRILGVLPDDCAIDTVFAVAVAATTSDPVAAGELVAFLTSADAAREAVAQNFGIPGE